jgi:uroporphyrinogen decarboxylase
MNHKERVLMALDHEEPDRVPVDLGGRQTTFMVETYEQFKSHLGINDLPTKMMSHKWQTVYVDEQILNRFSIDCRHVRPPVKAEPEFSETAEAKITFVDEWGVKRIIDAGYAIRQKYLITPVSGTKRSSCTARANMPLWGIWDHREIYSNRAGT